ncbi:MAG: putative DNA binding domain-containing protein [Nanoarchaeota archaeon]|nr:putative DNA binding domain-containing protein [Nanoarchaeota archaeon]
MNKEELIQRFGDIEWEDFEVKEAKSEIPKNSWETVSAFSNTAGGWLVFGVKKEGKNYSVLGVENPEKIEQDVICTLRGGEKFNKNIDIKCKKYKIDEKQVLAFYIPAAEKKPVFYNSPKNTFIRTGSGDQRATQEETDAMFREQAFSSKDKELTTYTLKDLDPKTIEDYRTYMKNFNPDHRYNKLDTEELLKRLNVLISGKVTVGGLLFFGKEEQINKIITDFRIDYLEIPGTSYSDASTRYTYRLSEEENLFRFYFSIIERLLKKIDIPFQLKSAGFASTDQPQATAIREALVNLLMHSEYFSSLKPRIRVFTDRIEFMNPGALPKDFKIIMKEDFSQPRNPIIARIFRAINLSENAGSGFDKMFSGWRSQYNKDPEVGGDVDYYKISFFFDAQKTLEKSDQKSSQKSDQKIIELISQNPEITIEELMQKLGYSESGVKKIIKKLKESGRIKRTGPDKGGRWEVVK